MWTHQDPFHDLMSLIMTFFVVYPKTQAPLGIFFFSFLFLFKCFRFLLLVGKLRATFSKHAVLPRRALQGVRLLYCRPSDGTVEPCWIRDRERHKDWSYMYLALLGNGPAGCQDARTNGNKLVSYHLGMDSRELYTG